MNIYIQLNLPDPSFFGPFFLYSDTDSFGTPFATGVPNSTLIAGDYFPAPDGTTIVKVCSLNEAYCNNCIEIPVIVTPEETSL
jgi:hypothetical protein